MISDDADLLVERDDKQPDLIAGPETELGEDGKWLCVQCGCFVDWDEW